MGAFYISVTEYYARIVEVVAIKTGIILTIEEVYEILKKQWPKDVNDPEHNGTIRMREDTMDAYIHHIRYKLGNITSDMRGPYLASKHLFKWMKAGYNPADALQKTGEFASNHKNQKIDPLILIKYLQTELDIPFDYAFDIVKSVAESQEQENYIYPSEVKEWLGGTPLSKLFNAEIKTDGSGFIPQGFLDYLAVNQDKLENIHWRNFERFCAAFFKKLNYTVELGPGSKDGGIDIRAYDDNNPDSPLIVIQCKRHSLSNAVKINVVKAFYADVQFENASHGIIITTSHIEPGGKSISQARHYPLSFFENEDVKQMAITMWRHAGKLK
ncbi:restriction endonuclease [[Flexibacter] sp. ATCC 35208]|uniref:restriction endonuclease n=1 Tax=[Flexibacter] sp. ATCC 35208 TaxID=1936242 RepID=UPI0009D61FBC|nr:restriction endonuclease [[Flexibacter] sp. ATCC 35208]OMP74730.1 hypothetical protein BW716_33855 [[Flexibacter] sp. ATCC 35208]